VSDHEGNATAQPLLSSLRPSHRSRGRAGPIFLPPVLLKPRSLLSFLPSFLLLCFSGVVRGNRRGFSAPRGGSRGALLCVAAVALGPARDESTGNGERRKYKHELKHTQIRRA
jgi:hypothetical protein